MITKKHDWTKGYWAFGIKIITPEGTTMEFEMPHVSEAKGKKVWNILGPLLGAKMPDSPAADIVVTEPETDG